MRTFRIFFWILLVCLIGGSLFFLLKRPVARASDGYCAFCDPTVLNRQKFYEDELVLALYTHKPVVPGHCLVIPKRHVERFEMLSEAEIARMGEVIKKVNVAAMKVFGTSSYLLLQKNGVEVGQTVPHVHFHYLPVKADGHYPGIGFMIKIYLSELRKPLKPAEMQENVETMRQAIKEES